MVRQIVFHLGDCKTGTTSIQTALAHRHFTLQGQTYLYPCRLNHIPLADTLRGKPDPALRQQRWSRIARQILESDKDTAIISAETFEFVRPESLAEAISTHFAGFDGQIRFISYIRPHAERFVSSFAEKSKQGRFNGNLDDGFKDFLSPRRITYMPRLDAWRRVFGDAYEVHPMIRDRLADGDVVTDFLRRAFRTDAVTVRDTGALNESLTVEGLIAARRLHERLRESGRCTDEISRAVGWNFAALLSTLPKSPDAEKPRIDKALARQLRKECMEDAVALDRTFFRDAPVMVDALSRAVDRAPDSVQSMAPADHFTAEQLRIIDGFGLLLRRVMEADPAHFRSAVRPEELRTRSTPKKPKGWLDHLRARWPWR